MTYAAHSESLSRTPVTYATITLDYCANSFGVAPCTATGECCYNTFHTCKDLANFDKTAKEYSFSSSTAPIPWAGPRPYIKSVTYLPTEITNDVTIKGRIKIELLDEPDSDVGIDPYLDTRSSVQGTFWKKLLARNPNYKGRTLALYEGFLGDALGEFQQRWAGPLELATIKKGVVTLESIDLLGGLADKEVPPKLNIKLSFAITNTDTVAYLVDGDDIASLPTSGYVRLDDEIVQYAGINTSQNSLTGLTRAQFGTTAAGHDAEVAVKLCRYFAPGNPFDLLLEILGTDAALSVGQIDSTAFAYWRDFPGGEVDLTALLTEPVKINDIYNEILTLIDCISWVGEDLKVTIARALPNEPARYYRPLTDSANIINDSGSVDLNADWRKTRIFLLWDKTVLGDADKYDSFLRRDIGVDAEGQAEYGDLLEEKILSRWIKYGIMQDEVLDGWISDMLARRVFSHRHAAPVLTFSLETKDTDIKTGSFTLISTDELSNPDGTDVTRRAIITRRDTKPGKADYKARLLSEQVFGFIADDDAPDYADATPAEREYTYIADEITGTVDGTRSYHIY